MSATPKTQLPKFEVTTHSEFRVIYANGFFGGLSADGGRIIFFTDILEPRIKTGAGPGEMEVGKVNREQQIDIRMSVIDFVNLASWMDRHVKQLQDRGILKKEDIVKSSPKATDYSV